MGSDFPRELVSLGLESRILRPNFASTYVTTSWRASSNVRKRYELRIRCFSISSGTNHSRSASPISFVQLFLHLLLVARHVGLPAFDTRLKLKKRASSRRNDRAQKVSLSSSCCRFISLLQSPPCLQRILPRVGDNVIRFITRESRGGSMHLLQNELQVLNSSFLVRICQQELRSIAVVVISVGCSADHSNIISDSLITPAKNASVFLGHCWKSSSCPVNSSGTSQTSHVNETRSILPTLSCREVIARTASASPDSAATCARRMNTSC